MTKMHLSRGAILSAVSVLVLGIPFVPISSLDCPSWDVWVIDRRGDPMPNMTVRLIYQDYSAEGQSHESNATTDGGGHVAFPARTLTASVGTRVAQILSFAREGAHASFGR